ncbi:MULTISPECIES: TetR/AcrR family transcriptional regulator [Streptomyces]|uniref:TetR/AcrR family transcriptional regulator n=1 Tax=Streptomyces TaxID=1883 RepID=UPI003428D350|nr:TetR/AcrR family transcriptional regulator [Streptomyces sp. NBC_00887]WSY36303.1 TetR/AcrR family transcriptional regulator [Streptomyces sp. NBC_00887]
MSTYRPGDERRRAVLERAMHLASVEGLEGISLGGLASALGMSKSGVQGLFGTKQELQLEVVAAATQDFAQRVLRKTEHADDGLPRLRALLEAWIDYLETFEGGCFFFATANEFDGRVGPVRDAITNAAASGYETLRKQIRLACRLGELASDTDVEQLIFEFHGAALQANYARRLLGQPDAYDRARRAIHERLDRGGGVS